MIHRPPHDDIAKHDQLACPNCGTAGPFSAFNIPPSPRNDIGFVGFGCLHCHSISCPTEFYSQATKRHG